MCKSESTYEATGEKRRATFALHSNTNELTRIILVTGFELVRLEPAELEVVPHHVKSLLDLA